MCRNVHGRGIAHPTLTCVPSLIELVRAHTDLDDGGRRLAPAAAGGLADHRRPVASPTWCCGCPTATGTGFWAGAQMRPTTGPTAYVDDMVGTFVPSGPPARCSTRRTPQGRLVREGDPEWRDDVPVRVETIPVRRGRAGHRGRRPQHQPARGAHPEPAGAVLPADRRRPDPDDRRAATSRCRGSAATTPTRRGSATGSCASTQPGRVVYASPNALSVYRRLGHLRRPRPGSRWPS